MTQRVQGALACGLISGCALGGLLGSPLWTFLIPGLALSLIAIWEEQKLRARFAAVGASDLLAMAHLASLANGCFTAGAAWGVGAVFRIALQWVSVP